MPDTNYFKILTLFSLTVFIITTILCGTAAAAAAAANNNNNRGKLRNSVSPGEISKPKAEQIQFLQQYSSFDYLDNFNNKNKGIFFDQTDWNNFQQKYDYEFGINSEMHPVIYLPGGKWVNTDSNNIVTSTTATTTDDFLPLTLMGLKHGYQFMQRLIKWWTSYLRNVVSPDEAVKFDVVLDYDGACFCKKKRRRLSKNDDDDNNNGNNINNKRKECTDLVIDLVFDEGDIEANLVMLNVPRFMENIMRMFLAFQLPWISSSEAFGIKSYEIREISKEQAKRFLPLKL